MSNNKTLLIVWVYYPASGHFVEALEAAANYHAANPSIKIHLMVNKDTIWRIGKYCGWIKEIHPVDVSEVISSGQEAACLQGIPRSFDYVVFPERLKYTPQDFTGDLLACNRTLLDLYEASQWGGCNAEETSHLNIIPYVPFRLTIPNELISEAESYKKGHPVFTVILKGESRESIWPPLGVWRSILSGIRKEYPECVFLVTGVLGSHLSNKSNCDMVKKKIADFVEGIPGAVNCYDLGIEKQLALIGISDVLISPHTGFAFLSSCVGTPWLALAGGRWAEPQPAGMPFYSVLPRCDKYPCHGGDMRVVCRLRLKLRLPVLCMGSMLNKSTGEILQGIRKLLSDDYTFDHAFQDYEGSAVAKGVNVGKIWRIERYKRTMGKAKYEEERGRLT
ncbi:MAG: hypothetical protein GF392_03305 [Candidatus Omnitrophica bacterium]|nr:hypothetical protein [Candidatus Omnitrophota bacterium]